MPRDSSSTADKVKKPAGKALPPSARQRPNKLLLDEAQQPHSGSSRDNEAAKEVKRPNAGASLNGHSPSSPDHSSPFQSTDTTPPLPIEADESLVQAIPIRSSNSQRQSPEAENPSSFSSTSGYPLDVGCNAPWGTPPSIAGQPKNLSPPNSYPDTYQYLPVRQPSSWKRQASFSSPKRRPPPPYARQPLSPRSPTFPSRPLDYRPSPTREAAGILDPYVTFQSFDTLANGGCASSIFVDNVLLLGSDGGLDVFKISCEKPVLLGSIRGIQGRVTSAKILPSTQLHDPLCEERPLVVLVRQALTARMDPSDAVPGPFDDTSHEKDHWQSHVEVFSLSGSKRISILYKSEVMPSQTTDWGSYHPSTLPALEFRVDANGPFITVISAFSGEIFIFTLVGGQSRTRCKEFHCIGKVWTTLHAPEPRQTSRSDPPDFPGQVEPPGSQTRTPLYSLGSRWLAIVPPLSSNLASVRGIPCCSNHQSKVPGMQTVTAPLPPPITCLLDMPQADSFVNRVARGVAQEMLKGASWVGDQGLQAWNKYWFGDSSKPDGIHDQGYGGRKFPQPARDIFPPTHGSTAIAPSDSGDKGNISIIDLHAFLNAIVSPNSVVAEPLASFPAPLGCSFLSMSPTGLALLVVSFKGDVQHVWDLSGLRIPRSGSLSTTKSSEFSDRQPCIYQIARYMRYTDAHVIDAVWTLPAGEQFALITERGTLHAFNLSQSLADSASTLHSRRKSSPGSQQAAYPESRSAQAFQSPTHYAPTMMSNAFQTISDKAQPLISAARTRSLSGGAGLLGNSNLPVTSSMGVKGGKAFASGVTKSLEVASDSITLLRHSGENRLRLESGVSPGCVQILSGYERGFVATATAGLVRLHTVRQATHVRGAERRLSVSKESRHEYAVTPPTENLQSAGQAPTDAESQIHGFWALPSAACVTDGGVEVVLHPLASAEIEVNSSDQPFQQHRRRQVSMLQDADSDEWGAHPTQQHLNDASPWCFGTLSGLKTVAVKTRSGFSKTEEEQTPAVDCRPQASRDDLDEFEILDAAGE